MADADGSNQVRLTDNNLYDAYPAWISSEVIESGVFPLVLSEIIQDLILNETGSSE